MDPEVKDEGFDVDAGVADIAASIGFEEAEVAEDDPVIDKPTQVVANAEVPVVVKAPPQSWAKEYHEHWTKLDPKAQEYIEKREKQMHEGLEQYKQFSGLGRTLSEAIAPYKQVLQQQGVDEAKAVSYLLATHQRLTTGTVEQRAAALAQLAQNLGLAQAQGDPMAKAAFETANELKQLITQKERRAYEQAQAKTAQEVEAFASDPAHQYFDEVAEQVVVFISAGDSLKDAYDKAVWANPVTRVKEQARLKEETEKQLREKGKQETEAARKARSANVRNQDTRKAPTEPLGKMDDTLKETLRDIQSRTH